jgi:hypothetical protein
MSAIVSPIELTAPAIQPQHAMIGNHPTVFPDIYRDEINIVIWQRKLADELIQTADHILKIKPTLQASFTVTPQNAYIAVNDALGASRETEALGKDISQLVDMFCCLFDLKRAGLRLTALSRAMCPRFHVDRVPSRLVTTYRGKATQWLPHYLVDRSKLGVGNQGKPDEQSGLFKETTDIQQLSCGDVALLKGELWQGNEGAGLVHRSPQLANDTCRLLLTLDFIND